ncbi:MAG: AMP-dependent synthetase [Oleiphilus sp.]|nr:MAG: AMP-dependent synthetase [Oleiphilus sp.]
MSAPAPLSGKVTIQENEAIRQANTFIDIFYEREKLHPNKVYLRQPFGDSWQEYTWSEVGQMARKLVTAMREMGLQQGDHVGLLSKNCMQWIVADLAILMGGYVSVPFYPTLPAKELEEVIGLSGIKALFVGKLEQWESQRSGVPSGLRTIAFPHYEGNSKVRGEFDWDTIMTECAPAEEVHSPQLDEVFTIIYTSGTTGTPKGVMIDYEGPRLIMQHERETPVYGVYQNVAERIISYLPLNHIAERVLSEFMPIVAGSTVSFTESLDKFADNLQSVKPTLFFAVPRIWTKFQQAILAKLPQRKLDLLLKIPIVSGLIKHKIKAGLGLDEVRLATSGAAPMSASLIEWFAKLDIHIQEVYGATEVCGGVTFNPVDDIAPGTVGRPVPGVEVKLDPETDEILIKTPWVMKGYYQSPEKTEEVLQDGYYHTGDTGRLDQEGRLIVTGRIKDTFKTAKGKFVLPVPIEHEISRHEFVEQVMVTGIGLVQPLALVCLSENTLNLPRDELAAELGKLLGDLNHQLDSYSKLSHIVVFRELWAEDSGFFTPTLKIKRHIVDQHFRDKYAEWTQSKIRIVWA